MLNDTEVRDEYQKNYRYAHDFWAPYQVDTETYTLAASGYTWSEQERRDLIKEGREPIEFNIIRRPLQFYSGYLRDNINSIVYSPVEGSDQKTADQFTKLGYYVWDKGQGFETFLSACDEGFKSGISLCGVHLDYTKDFINGDIAFNKRCYNQFYLDPTFEKLDLSDCSFAITRDLVSREECKALLPFVDPELIDNLQYSFRDNKFIRYQPTFTNYTNTRSVIAYDQYYRRTSRDRTFLIDIDSSFYRDITDLPEDEKDKLKLGMTRFDLMRDELEGDEEAVKEIPNVEIKTVSRPFVELSIFLNSELVYRGEDKTGIVDTYPFVPILCYMEPSIWLPSQRIMGIAGTQYFNQRQFNKRHMKIIDMMDSTISTGYKYLIGTVPDPQDMQQSGQNKMIGVDPENNPAGLDAVQELHGGGTNPALMEYQKVLDDLSLTLANINESVLGVDDKGNTQISGRLAQVRIAQGLRGNRKIFDQVENSQQLLGGLVLKVIQNHMPAGKVMRILGEEPTEQFYSKDFEQYDAVVKEGIRSKSQQDAYYYELVNLKKEGIVDVPQAEIVRALQMAGLSDLEEAMKKADEERAQVSKTAEELQQMQLQVLNATKEEKLGLAKERESRVQSNLSLKDERESEAQQNIAQAALDRARAISEISKLNEDRILQVLGFVNSLEQQEAIGREAQKAQVKNQSEQISAQIDMSDVQVGQEEQQTNAMAQLSQGV
jgi:hypothetical protein